MSYREHIADVMMDGAILRVKIARSMWEQIEGAAMVIAEAFKAGNKLLLFGNGGSAADAQHIAAEFVNRFQIERPPLPAIALTTDTSVLTSIANDYAFDEIFSKQVKALGKKGDVAIGISTSGSSRNVIKGLQAARGIGMVTIVLTRLDCETASFADLALKVPSDSTPRIQEAHIAIGHVLCELVDEITFGRGGRE